MYWPPPFTGTRSSFSLKFLQNIGTILPDFIVPHFKRPWLWSQNNIFYQKSYIVLVGYWQIWHSENRASWYILIIKTDEMHCSHLYLVKNSTCFRKIYCPSPRVLILYVVFTAIGICHTSYVASLLASSSILTSLADRQHN